MPDPNGQSCQSIWPTTKADYGITLVVSSWGLTINERCNRRRGVQALTQGGLEANYYSTITMYMLSPLPTCHPADSPEDGVCLVCAHMYVSGFLLQWRCRVHISGGTAIRQVSADTGSDPALRVARVIIYLPHEARSVNHTELASQLLPWSMYLA